MSLAFEIFPLSLVVDVGCFLPPTFIKKRAMISTYMHVPILSKYTRFGHVIENTKHKLNKDNIQGSGEFWTSPNLQSQTVLDFLDCHTMHCNEKNTR